MHTTNAVPTQFMDVFFLLFRLFTYIRLYTFCYIVFIMHQHIFNNSNVIVFVISANGKRKKYEKSVYDRIKKDGKLHT